MFDKNAWQRERRKSNPDKYREYDRAHALKRRSQPGYSEYQADKVLKCRYGISLEQKREMYDEQKGLCKVCGERLPEDFRKAHVDHDHATENIRGLVHWSCNKLIGFVENNVDLIESIYVYLKLRSQN